MSAAATLLTDADLAELTGYIQPAEQARVLREHHLQPVIRRDGKPRVTWEAVTHAMIEQTTVTGTPRFELLRKTG